MALAIAITVGVAGALVQGLGELLADIGTKASRRNPLVEKFTPPDADAYARFLATAPVYKAVA